MDEAQRVLVVDDHTDACELLCLHLERLGHRCREAKDGKTGIAIAHELEPDVAIVDLWLPDMTGHDVARALRQRDPHVYLIALTGSTRAEDRSKAFEAGFDEFLMKPADNRTLLDLLAKAKQRRTPGHEGS
jgi:two-component system, sensor histidine kinase